MERPSDELRGIVAEKVRAFRELPDDEAESGLNEILTHLLEKLDKEVGTDFSRQISEEPSRLGKHSD